MGRERLIAAPAGQHDIKPVLGREFEHGNLVGQIGNTFQFHGAFQKGEEIVFVGSAVSDRYITGGGNNPLAFIMPRH